MATSIKVNLSVDVAGGPKKAVPVNLALSAYDVVQTTIAASNGTAATRATLALQPSAVDHVVLVLITADKYDATGKLRFTLFDDDAAAGTARNLSGPIALVGESVVATVGLAPRNLAIESTLTEPVVLEALVGRRA